MPVTLEYVTLFVSWQPPRGLRILLKPARVCVFHNTLAPNTFPLFIVLSSLNNQNTLQTQTNAFVPTHSFLFPSTSSNLFSLQNSVFTNVLAFHRVCRFF